MNQDGFSCSACGISGDSLKLAELAKSFDFSTGKKIDTEELNYHSSKDNGLPDRKKSFGSNAIYDPEEAWFWYKKAIINYKEFNGRAHRREYWYFFLQNTLYSLFAAFFDIMLGTGGVITGIYALFVLSPSVAIGVRRMHDTGRSGWWLLFPLLNLYFAISKGTKGDNLFGSDPQAA